MSQTYNPAAIMHNADTHSGVTNAKLGLLSVTMAMVGGIGWLLWKVEGKRAAEEARG